MLFRSHADNAEAHLAMNFSTQEGAPNHIIHNVAVTATSQDSHADATIIGSVRLEATSQNYDTLDKYIYGVTVEASGVSSTAYLSQNSLNNSISNGHINDLIVTTGPVNSDGPTQPNSLSIGDGARAEAYLDRKSTRLNSSHMSESRMPSSA